MTAAGVQLTGRGVDVLFVVLLCCCVVILERTVGDSLSDLIGPGLATVVFAALVGAGVWSLFTDGGKAEQFYATAERAGYQTLYYDRGVARDPDGSRAVPPSPDRAVPAADGGVSAASSTTRGTPVADAGPPATERRDAPVGVSGTITPADVELTVRLEMPEMSVTGRPFTIRARVSAGGRPVSGAHVTFTVDGRPAGVAISDGAGVASTPFVPRAARAHNVRAQVASTQGFRAVRTAGVVYILPARS